MIEHIWTVFCSRSIIDPDSNNISLIDIIERVEIQTPREKETENVLAEGIFELVTLWGRVDYAQPASGIARMLVLAPNGDAIGKPFEYKIDLTKQHIRWRQRVKFGGIPFKIVGKQLFVVELQEDSGAWKRVAQIPLEIAFAPITGQKKEL